LRFQIREPRRARLPLSIVVIQEVRTRDVLVLQTTVNVQYVVALDHDDR